MTVQAMRGTKSGKTDLEALHSHRSTHLVQQAGTCCSIMARPGLAKFMGADRSCLTRVLRILGACVIEGPPLALRFQWERAQLARPIVNILSKKPDKYLSYRKPGNRCSKTCCTLWGLTEAA